MRSRVARTGAAACVAAAALLCAAPAVGAAAGPRITAKPGLSPVFKRSITDYVVRCERGKPLEFRIDAPTGVAVGVDGAKPRSGGFTALVPLGTGQATELVVRSNGRDKRHHVRCLPRGFPRWSFRRFAASQARWFLFAPVPNAFGGSSSHYVIVMNARGVPVWWRREPEVPFNSTLLANGQLAWGRWYSAPFSVNPAGAWEVHRLDGSLVRTLRITGSPTDMHDMRPLANGNYLLISYKLRRGVDLRAYGGARRGAVLDGEIQELTPGGKRVWRWNSKDHVKLAENVRWRFAHEELPDGTDGYDYFHLNSVEPDGDGLIISARHVDAVYRIDRATGNVVWKLGGTTRPESLQVVGDTRPEPFIGQHDARLLADGTLTVFDNHVFYGQPRGVLFRIDPTSGKATLVEQATDPKVDISGAEGSARRLRGGNWVVSWGATHVMSEVSPPSRPVWRLTFAKGQNYRVTPIPAGRIAASSIRRAMDRMHPRGRR